MLKNYIHQEKFPDLFPEEAHADVYFCFRDCVYKNHKGITVLQRPPPSPFVRSYTFLDPYAIFDLKKNFGELRRLSLIQRCRIICISALL